MKHLLFIIAALLSFAVFEGCNSSQVEKESRSPGEIAFRSNCQRCHILPKPSMKSDEQWPAIVSKYGDKANLTITDQKQILAYLIANN
ncbi:MAG: hypothetical protein DWP97_08780 [Calditrichaeota bacterium]|nr:MAG: hypothetical protein DWP97_08780 [Calditrichota bacterium]